jgi:putative spermidine/putrescine transport system substrate-binding protein
MTKKSKYTTPARAISRRRFMAGAGKTALGVGAASVIGAPFINHAWSQDVSYDGGIFDAGGASLRIAEWGGIWEELVRKNVLDQFEKDFNAKIEYDSAFPWSPKMIPSGPTKPIYDLINWNMPDMFQIHGIGDYLEPLDVVKENVPNSKDLWDFATVTNVGLTWLFSTYGYAYRTDLVEDPPTKFEDMWRPEFADLRGNYTTPNTLFQVHFMVASEVFGSGPTDMKAGLDAYKELMPMKLTDFSTTMGQMLERGEVVIANHHDGEPYALMDKGVPLGWMYWTVREPVLTQTKTISLYSEPMQKKLAYALLNRYADTPLQEAMGEFLYMQGTNRNMVTPPGLRSKGINNTAEAATSKWIPPWDYWVENQQEITERVNRIYSS